MACYVHFRYWLQFQTGNMQNQMKQNKMRNHCYNSYFNRHAACNGHFAVFLCVHYIVHCLFSVSTRQLQWNKDALLFFHDATCEEPCGTTRNGGQKRAGGRRNPTQQLQACANTRTRVSFGSGSASALTYNTQIQLKRQTMFRVALKL